MNLALRERLDQQLSLTVYVDRAIGDGLRRHRHDQRRAPVDRLTDMRYASSRDMPSTRSPAYASFEKIHAGRERYVGAARLDHEKRAIVVHVALRHDRRDTDRRGLTVETFGQVDVGEPEASSTAEARRLSRSCARRARPTPVIPSRASRGSQAGVRTSDSRGRPASAAVAYETGSIDAPTDLDFPPTISGQSSPLDFELGAAAGRTARP